MQSHRHHKPHGSRHRKRDRRAGSIATQQSEESETAASSHGNTHKTSSETTPLLQVACCVSLDLHIHIVLAECRICTLTFTPARDEVVIK